MGFAVGNPMNLLMVIAVYATISKQLGLPLRFPGTEAAYRALYQVTSANILARATDWAGSTPGAANEIFNITNGDYFRGQHMWPRIAKAFHMERSDPVPTPLTNYMTDKAALWDEIVRKHNLQQIPMSSLFRGASATLSSITVSTTSAARSKLEEPAFRTVLIQKICSLISSTSFAETRLFLNWHNLYWQPKPACTSWLMAP